MSLNADYQKLESGNDVRLIEVDGSSFGLTDVLRFHNYSIPHTEAEIEATNPVSPIRLNKPVLDSRVTFTRAGAASYIGQDGKIYQAAANQWPLADISGLGRAEPEKEAINLLRTSASFSDWSVAAATKGVGVTSIFSGLNSILVTATATAYPRMAKTAPIVDGQYTCAFIVKKGSTNFCHATIERASGLKGTIRFYLNLTTGEIKSSSVVGSIVLNSLAVKVLQDGWFLVSATVTITGLESVIVFVGPSGRFGSSEANIGDSINVAFSQLESGSVVSSPIITTTTSTPRSASTASIQANGASGIKITYSTGETTNLSFGSASSIQIPTATKAWGTRYITGIEYVGGVPTYDDSKLPAKPIWWQGNEYAAWPYQLEGLEKSTSGSNATPSLTVANIESSISALCLAYDDLLQAKVTIHDTKEKYLDARNFADGNPTADPTQEKLQVWYIDGKTGELAGETVEFVLSSPMDLQGQMIPTRQLHSLCTWCIRNKYRTGDGCDYAGTRYFDKNNNPVSDPSLDECNGTLTACKLRFGENNELSHGGFPGTSLIRS